MGAPFIKVWADGWDQARPIIDAAFAGRCKRFVDLPWKLDTDRGSADTWRTFSYSRVLDEDGGIAGLFIFTNETTARVLTDKTLRLIEADPARFHVVFSDVVMPGMNDVDLATVIRNEHPDLPVVLTSGYSHVFAQNAQHGFELLHKPYSVEQLSHALRKAIARSNRDREPN